LRLPTCLLFPTVRLAHSSPVRHVRKEFPLRATCFRRVLPPVVGFPHFRVLCSIRLPIRIRRAFPVTVLLRLPSALSASTLRFQHRSVSGFPLVCPNSCIPSADNTSRSQERMGPPKFFDASLPACHGLWTPADLHILAKTDDLVLPSVSVKTLGIRNSHVEAVPALQGTRLPLRPTGCSVDASSIVFAVITTTTPPWTQDSIRVGG
jgi:hypothetical protein